MAQGMLFTFLFAQAIASDVSSSDGSCSVAGSVGLPGCSGDPRGSLSVSLLQTGRGQGSLVAEAGVNESNLANLHSGGYASSYHETDWQDAGEGKVVYLDRHNVICPTGAIQGFQLQRKGEQFRYKVKCSDELTWVNDKNVVSKKTKAKALMEGKEGYLNDYWAMMRNSHVQCPWGFALREFQLKTWHARDYTFWEAVWENMRLVYDIIDIIDPKDENSRMSLMWYEYKCVQINEHKFETERIHWKTTPTKRVQNSGYDSYYLDRQAVFAPDNGLMTEFWSNWVSYYKFDFDFKFAQKK